MTNTTYCIRINTSAETEMKLHNITEQALWLKGWLHSWVFDWFGGHGSEVHSNIRNCFVLFFFLGSNHFIEGLRRKVKREEDKETQHPLVWLEPHPSSITVPQKSRNCLAYSYHSNLPGTLHSPKSFKCMLRSPNHHANDHPEKWNIKKGTKGMIN